MGDSSLLHLYDNTVIADSRKSGLLPQDLKLPSSSQSHWYFKGLHIQFFLNLWQPYMSLFLFYCIEKKFKQSFKFRLHSLCNKALIIQVVLTTQQYKSEIYIYFLSKQLEPSYFQAMNCLTIILIVIIPHSHIQKLKYIESISYFLKYYNLSLC